MITMFRGPGAVSASSTGGPSIGLNVFVLPAAYGHAFLAFCYANYSSGSVVDFSKEGDPTLLAGIRPIDVRTAAASYDLMEGDRLVERVENLTSSWRDDLVAIGIGCSVALDEVLKSNGLVPKHAR